MLTRTTCPSRHTAQKGRGRGPGSLVVDDLMRDIRDVYRRWLDGNLSQEDTLFAIGDLLDRNGVGNGDGDLLEDRQAGRQAVGRKAP